MAETVLTTGDVARRFGVSRERVQQLADAGKLVPSFRTASGIRLFLESTVERFVAERERRAEQR